MRRQLEGKGKQWEGKRMESSTRGRKGCLRGGVGKDDKIHPNSNIFFLTTEFSIKQCGEYLKPTLST